MVKNQYLLLLISELYERIQGSQWFTALDIKKAFNLVKIKEGKEWKAAFHRRYEHYKYSVMLFELMNTLATF